MLHRGVHSTAGRQAGPRRPPRSTGGANTARDFLGLNALIIFVVGLAPLPALGALRTLPGLGIAVTMFVRGAFVIHCDVTFDAEGVVRPYR